MSSVDSASAESLAIDDVRAKLDGIAVERAVAEFRAGRPVAVHGQNPILAFAAESFGGGAATLMHDVHRAYARYPELCANVVMTGQRLARLGFHKPPSVGTIALGAIHEVDVQELIADLPEGRDTPYAGRELHEATATEMCAVELARLALLLPAVICLDISLSDRLPVGTLAIHQSAIASHATGRLSQLDIVSRASCPLSDAIDAEIVVFRGLGLREQVALLVGSPDHTRPISVRVHSACMTGDLFGSLRCDCGEQLRNAVRHMAENGGGILLYLDHEGRGIGLANKIRAYKLQSQGLDTYEANNVLGFGSDDRSYEVAALMLKLLKISRVCLLTNNMGKASALREAGIEVQDTIRCHGNISNFNRSYLLAKKTITNHLICEDDLCSIYRDESRSRSLSVRF